ncbi:hypothetical protein B1B04_24980 [Lysinibacillus sp. KCTC 33748]|uniref:LamG domain-containing protein n=1 Tax=unclassified Lysinibacillus TaxID=2636778 RepID=UPI0009A76067|nr:MULTISPECIES: LamG domain-containing protein [unclassified Lysinibacillus]OXS65586.1 hypothetical protein B1B04_24980 [Lysinibacillus sp. KCTC 33748]SKC19625.1 Concanavalin A-like lectin/glucanases superfamily protein [Lysinibacillus sp. AC-3]
MDIVTSYDNWGGKGDRRKILSGNPEVFDGTESTYMYYGNLAQINIDIIFSGLEGKLYIDGIKVIRTNYGFINKEILLNGKYIGTFNDNVDSPLPMLTIRKNDKLTIRGKNNQTGGGTYPTYIREIELKTYFVPDKSFIYHEGEYKKVKREEVNSVFYNGTSSYMRTTKVHKYNIVTLETWVKPYVISSSYQDIMSNVENGGHSIGLLNGKPYSRFYLNGAYRYCYGNELPLNQWSHIATTFDGNTILFYINGVKVSELKYSGEVSNTSAIFSIGANPAVTSGYIEYFKGEIKDSRIWDVARTELQISTNMYQLSEKDSMSDNLVAWYPQDETFGTVCKDKSKYAGDGTYSNTTVLSEYLPKRIVSFSNTLPSSTQFLEHGISLPPLFDREVTELEPTEMTLKKDILVSGEVGKVFSKPIDLKKHFDIRAIRTEVR